MSPKSILQVFRFIHSYTLGLDVRLQFKLTLEHKLDYCKVSNTDPQETDPTVNRYLLRSVFNGEFLWGRMSLFFQRKLPFKILLIRTNQGLFTLYSMSIRKFGCEWHVLIFAHRWSGLTDCFNEFLRDGCLDDLGRSSSDDIDDQWINKNQKNLEFKVNWISSIDNWLSNYNHIFRLLHSMKEPMFFLNVNFTCALAVIVICQLLIRFLSRGEIKISNFVLVF